MKMPFLKPQDTHKYTKNIVPGKYQPNIGDHTYGDPKILSWDNAAQLQIGKYCSFAKDVTIMLGGEHRIDHVTRQEIERGVIIGAAALGKHRAITR